MSRRALLVINRKSRRGRDALEPVTATLRDSGIALVERPCGSADDLAPLIAAEGRGMDLIVVGGGDGTLNAALEGLVELDVPLGLIPLGTANDLARTLGIPTDPATAAKIVAGGVVRRIDLGQANDKLFANVASLGLSVSVARALSRDIKRRWGRLGYAVGAARALGAIRPFEATILCDGESTVIEALQVAVGNGRHFGGGMTVADDARIDDARLDLFTLPPSGTLRLFAFLAHLRWGRHGRLEEVLTARGRAIDVATLRPMPVNTDGEITTATPVRFRVRPQALSVMVPAP